MTRLALRQLPRPVIAFIEETLGAKIVSFENQAGGFSLGAAARVLTKAGSRGFVKAIGRAGFEGSYELYKREANILSALPPGGNIPRLLGALEVEDWIVLVMQDVAGHHPRTPGRRLLFWTHYYSFQRLPRWAIFLMPGRTSLFHFPGGRMSNQNSAR